MIGLNHNFEKLIRFWTFPSANSLVRDLTEAACEYQWDFNRSVWGANANTYKTVKKQWICGQHIAWEIGTASGTQVRYNFFYNITGPGNLGATAVYHDDEISGVVVYGNVWYKTDRVLLLGGGRDNIFDNNLIINNTVCIYVDSRGFPGFRPQNNDELYKNLAAVLYKSPHWSAQYPTGQGRFADRKFDFHL